MRRRVVVAVLWTLSLVSVAAVTSAAQRFSQPRGVEPEIIAGADVGFRVDHYNGTTPVGELVVKRDGKWVVVEFGARIKPTR